MVTNYKHIAIQLELEMESRCEVAVAVLGDEVLLGAIPMEDMDLVLLPGRREITVDPCSPNIPHARVKHVNTDYWVRNIVLAFCPSGHILGKIFILMIHGFTKP